MQIREGGRVSDDFHMLFYTTHIMYFVSVKYIGAIFIGKVRYERAYVVA